MTVNWVSPLRDRVVLSLVALAMLGGGILALCWPTSLSEYDKWGFRIHCGSGLVADYSQATIADQVQPTEHKADYAGQCQTAVWLRRGWAYPLALAGVGGSVAVLAGRPRKANVVWD